MNYEQTIHYLYNKLPLYSNVGLKAYKADLTNTFALCREMDNPQNKIKTIHIAGTNGKGSTSHMLAAIFQQNGYKTGLYTSPHLKDFRERIRINGAMVSHYFVIDFTEKIKTISEEIEPSFFELTFVMALQYFAEQKVDVAIIETGLGGRLDSTNVITPEVSIITNIGYDHVDILGDTLEKIAFEKAGIIKQNTPVVIGETLPETKKVFLEKATAMSAPVTFSEEIYKIDSANNIRNTLNVILKHNGKAQTKKYSLDLSGNYQQKNLRTVITATDILKNKFSLTEKNITDALTNVKKLTGLHGRWEVIRQEPLTVLDVAHNVDGIQQVIQQINITPHENLHIIFGMVKDKEIDKVLQLLPKNAIYYFTKAQIPRALNEEQLTQKALHYLLKGKSFAKVNDALKAALQAASPNDLIIVCGSVFIVGEVDVKVISDQ